MKHKTFRRILSAALTLCMVLTLLPTGAFAATTVTVGSTKLSVEYFTSTLYNWDEVAANVATYAADAADGTTTSWQEERVYYSTNTAGGNDPYSSYENSTYYVQVNAAYCLVTNIECSKESSDPDVYDDYTWTITYTDDSGNTGTITTDTSEYDFVDCWNNIYLYYQNSSATQEGKGFYFTESLWSDSVLELEKTFGVVPFYSKWVSSAQNYYIYSGLAASTLSESSNAPFADGVNAAALFATDGTNTDYADVYTNVSVPFVYDSETGYYTLNSDANAVYFADGEAASNATMAIADKPAAYYSESSGGYVTGFAPFDDLTDTEKSAIVSGSDSKTTTAYVIEDEDAEEGEETPTYGFGMVTTVDFTMTSDGKDSSTGKDITFEFSGDDDVWVYIDDVLVLDIGGTHEAVNGTINFNTGAVTLTSDYNTVGDLASDPTMSNSSTSLSQTNVYTALATTQSAFSSAGAHTLTIYYMDRGQNRTNSMITFNLPLAIEAVDDTIVLDYGLPVQVDVLANDTVTSNGVAVSGSDVTLTINNADDLTYGTASVDKDADSNSFIVYTPTKQLNGIETIEYTVTADGRSDTATLTVIPATLMYYEEDFGEMLSFSKAAVTWTATDTSNVTYQETGFVGDEDDSTYGTDVAYLSNLGDSGGTSVYADVSESYGAYFEYDFTGTGTAVLARTSTDSAYIRVQIWHEDEDGNDVYDDWQYIDTRVVDNVANETTLYNIPVYNNEDLEFGTYHVKVFIYKEGTPVSGYYDDSGDLVEGSDESGGTFYLDGIRVYNPMGTCEEDGVAGYTTAEAAYVADGENLMSTVNIHAKVVDDANEDWLSNFSTVTDNKLTIDYDSSDDDAADTVVTYSVDSANEEYYLYNGDSNVACFLVNWDTTKDYRLYLGIKSPSGTTAGKVTIGDEDGTEGEDYVTLTISNGTVCYYDVTDYLIVDEAEDDDGETYYYATLYITSDSGLVALTNLKLTGGEFSFVNGEEYTVTNGGSDNSNARSAAYTGTYTMAVAAFAYTVEEEEEEATVFEPENITVSCGWSSKTKKATVTIRSSDDVARLTINGVDVSSTNATATLKSGSTYITYDLKWSKSYTKVTSGTTYEIVAYDADGNASETYTVTAE